MRDGDEGQCNVSDQDDGIFVVEEGVLVASSACSQYSPDFGASGKRKAARSKQGTASRDDSGREHCRDLDLGPAPTQKGIHFCHGERHQTGNPESL